jgi:hypothetical protein
MGWEFARATLQKKLSKCEKERGRDDRDSEEDGK